MVVVIDNHLSVDIIQYNQPGYSIVELIWNGNVEHIAQHGLTQDDVQHVFDNPIGYGISRTSGEPAVFGYTPDGRYIIVVYCEIDEYSAYPVSAFEVPESPG